MLYNDPDNDVLKVEADIRARENNHDADLNVCDEISAVFQATIKQESNILISDAKFGKDDRFYRWQVK